MPQQRVAVIRDCQDSSHSGVEQKRSRRHLTVGKNRNLVVATGTGGSGEYLRDGENCLLFGREDAGALRRDILSRSPAGLPRGLPGQARH